MAKSVNISLLGDKELERKFAQLDLKMQKKLAKAVIGKAIKPVLAKAKSLVPVGEYPPGSGRTGGALKNSLHIKQVRGKGKIIGSKVTTGTRKELGIDPKEKAYYPASVEYGHPGAAAKPYLRPAIDSQKGTLLEILASELGKLVEVAAKSSSSGGGGSVEDASTRGSSTERVIKSQHTGKRGGRFTISASGKKVYIRKKK